ncbi:hypothetical protein D3C73_1358670 [compost metagenome]
MIILITAVLAVFIMTMMALMMVFRIVDKPVIAVPLIGFIHIATVEFTHLCTA